MKRFRVFAVLATVILLMMASAQAAASIDAERNVGLTVMLQDEGEGIAGATIRIYRIADIDSEGKPTVVSPFDRYPVDFGEQDETSMSKAASTLEGYVLRDNLAPFASSLTDQEGRARFSAGNLVKQGWYLVVGGRHEANGVKYVIQPSVVQLPMWDSANKVWIYDVTIQAKHESVPEWPEGHKISRKVLKIWEDDGHDIEIPEEIVVHLLRDGEVFDSVSLTAEMLWRHRWDDLDPDYRWTVVEEELADFSVTVTQEGITFVITNKYIPLGPDETQTPEPTSTPDPVQTPEVTQTPDPMQTPEVTQMPEVTPTSTPKPTRTPDHQPDDPTLPQTGQYWWPVAMLICGGLLLIVIGLFRRRGN